MWTGNCWPVVGCCGGRVVAVVVVVSGLVALLVVAWVHVASLGADHASVTGRCVVVVSAAGEAAVSVIALVAFVVVVLSIGGANKNGNKCKCDDEFLMWFVVGDR